MVSMKILFFVNHVGQQKLCCYGGRIKNASMEMNRITDIPQAQISSTVLAQPQNNGYD